MWGILGSLEVTSLVPGSWRLSGSMILQTTALTILMWIVLKVVQYVRYRRWLEKEFGDAPGPKEKHWLFGNLANIPKDEAKRAQYYLDLNEKYGEKGYLRFYGGFCQPLMVVTAPETMKRILKTAEPKPLSFTGVYRFLRPWLGDGLLLAGGAKHQRNRKLLTSAFHFDILKPYIDVYNKAADILIEKLDRCAQEKTSFEVFQEISKCTLDIILKCAFSYQSDVQKQGESNLYVKAMNDLSVRTAMRFRKPHLYLDMFWNLSSMGRKFNKDCDYVHSIANEVITKRQETLKHEGELGRLKDRKYLDFLDILLTAKDENGKGLTPLEIRNEVDTFMFGGHDTTASAISWILFSLAEHRELQKRCQKEIDELLEGRETDDIQWDDLNNLEYLTMCIKEGLRLHCPVPIVGREITTELDIGDRVIPRNTVISISMWALHHNKRVWDKDMEYIPERFSKENISRMDPYQFVPFSAGPRNCIGQHFAMNEEKVVIAKLLRTFSFELVPGQVIRKRIAAVMRSEKGIMMLAKRRQHEHK